MPISPISRRRLMATSAAAFAAAGALTPLKALAAASKDQALETMKKATRFMVEKAADEKLDGYRELGQRAARAENALDRVKGDSAFVQKELQEQLTRFVDDVRDVMDSMDPDSAACKELCEALRKLKGAV